MMLWYLSVLQLDGNSYKLRFYWVLLKENGEEVYWEEYNQESDEWYTSEKKRVAQFSARLAGESQMCVACVLE